MLQNVTANELISKIAQDYGLQTGVLDEAQYRIPSLIEDNKKLLDIIMGAVGSELQNSGQLLAFYDDFGKLSLRSADYGTEWNLLLGKDRLLVRAELQRIVSEALLQDERIRGLEQAEITFNGDQVSFNCTVVTYYGNFELRKELIDSV